MIEKIIPSRITNKHDTEANWNAKSDFIPKQGEFIVYDKDDTHACARLKMGDGETTIVNLPFISITPEDMDEILNNLQIQIDNGSIQISKVQPSFACTWFRPVE